MAQGRGRGVAAREDAPLPTLRSTEELAAAVRRVPLAAAQLHRNLRVVTDVRLGRAGYQALASVYQHEPIRAGDLADVEGVEASNMSRTLRRLLAIGYVSRRRDSEDGRAWLIEMTDEGRQEFERLRSETVAFLLGRFDRLTSQEQEAVIAAGPALEALVRVTRPEPREGR